MITFRAIIARDLRLGARQGGLGTAIGFLLALIVLVEGQKRKWFDVSIGVVDACGVGFSIIQLGVSKSAANCLFFCAFFRD